MRLLALAALVAAAYFFVESRVAYYDTSYDWQSFYDPWTKLGERCGVAVGDWREGDSARGVLDRRHETTALSMPYRSADPARWPQVGAGQYLYTRCDVDLTGMRFDRFGWARLHQAFGESSVFLNGTLRQMRSDGGDFEFPLLPSDAAAGVLEVVSRPTAQRSNNLGFATRMPLAATDDQMAVAMANIASSFDLILKPTFWLNFSLVFCLVFGVAWAGGLRLPHLGWMLVAAALDVLMMRVIFSPANVFPPEARLINAVGAVARNLAFAAACYTFLRGARARTRENAVVTTVVVGLTALFYGATLLPLSPAGKANLFRYVQWYTAGVAFLVVVALTWRGQRGRGRFVWWFSLVFAVAQAVTIATVQTTGVSLLPPLMEAGWLLFASFLVLDLVVYRRRAAELQAVTTTTMMIAHDVRRPFSMIRLLLGELASRPLDAESRRVVARFDGEIQRSVRKAEAMLSDILDVDRAATLALAPAAVEDLVREAVADRDWQGTDVQFEWQIDAQAAVMADRARLVRVLDNILDNAVQAMQGRGRIRFATRVVTPGMIAIDVGNDGPMIPARSRARLFEAFFTEGKAGGTGLGLAAARRILQAHSGDLGCTSTPEETVFSLTLAVAPASTAAAAVTASSGKSRVALIEDNAIFRAAWREALTDVEIDEFESADAFLSAVGPKPSDLSERYAGALLDNYFDDGELTGIELARRLRAGGCKLPLVLVSDLPGLDAASAALFNAVVSKDPRSWGDVERVLT